MVALPLAILVIVPSWLCGKSLMNISGMVRIEYSKAGTTAEQAISSIRTVYAFVGGEKDSGSRKLGLRQGLLKGLAIGSNQASIFATWILMFYYGSRLVMYHGAQGGTIFGAGALNAGLSSMKDIADACIASKRIMEVTQRIPKIDSDDTEGIILEHVSGEIEFKQVKFSYPSRPESVVLKNFSLTISAGKTIALVGASGSGKSTVLLLLQRFYNPLEGEIFLDMIATNKLQLKWLRSQMALVSQEPSLFSTTIKENILFGKEDATMEEIVEASKACDAHNFITQLPQGYDTQVGERGIQLSRGQKQRIAIARAIMRKPRILLLDEATSALDSESERVVQEAIDKVAVSRTTIIIAHRLSTIKYSNTIAVVENGQVKEIGSHNELIQEENGLYKSLVCLQQMEKEIIPSSPSKMDLDISTSNVVNVEKAPDSPTLELRSHSFKDSINTSRPLFWRFLDLNKPKWKQVTLGCLSSILSGALMPLNSVAMGLMISVYFSTNRHEIKERVRNQALWLFGLSVCSILFNVCQHYSFADVGENLTKRIRGRMLSKILTFEVGWFDKDENSSSVICSRITKDANMVSSLMGDKISFLVQAFSTITISWTIGLVVAWRLAIVLIVVQPFIIASIYAKHFLLKNMSKGANKAQDESTELAAEAVSNIQTVTAFSSQGRILKMLEKAQENQRKENICESWLAGIALGVFLSVKSAEWCLTYWYSGKLVFEGYISPRAAFQTIIILMVAKRAIIDVGSLTTTIFKGCDAFSLVFSILDRDTRIEPENLEDYKPETIIGHIELDNIHFVYPTRPNVLIFKDFSMDIEGGKSTALVGKSGSGKSTIIALIERFYDPLKGVVKIDGRDIRSYHLRSLRKFIAVVNQKPTLFAGTIGDNITYGLDNVTESEIIESAKASNVHDFIMRQEHGYKTWCGDKGLQLSGGQKQRIAIARAILRNPAILLLDEATSALDSHSEKMVQTTLEVVMKGRTSVVVAHRLCTIQNCDQIVVMDEGVIIEKGTHYSLMAKGTHYSLMAKGPVGAYHSLISLQSV
ncbi:ABC transporter [Parasponia andersonii]|uniref:ABC transporter n=1 Tax=Parasponia andersonii TaxID=3476 RepID=A0A2P5CUB2_PARAD|nr:ABC transporter [Parasponia andersonii]